MLYGLMTEEINYSYDGGIYGELVRDRVSDAAWTGLSHWPMVARGKSVVQVSLDETTGPSAALATEPEGERDFGTRLRRRGSRTMATGESRCGRTRSTADRFMRRPTVPGWR